MIVAIHQPNYAPWLGYFAKMAQADIFVFLDDAQYSKNSYINRVQIDARGKARWLTVPVSYRFGDAIHRVRVADDQWRSSHLSTLQSCYAEAPAFAEVWSFISEAFSSQALASEALAAVSADNLAAANQGLIEALAGRLGLRRRFMRASDFTVGAAKGDDRLIAILRALGPEVAYLSGKGGANYQDPAKFAAAGIDLRYVGFMHPTYDQGHEPFLPGLSILDTLFRLGFARTAALITPAMPTGSR